MQIADALRYRSILGVLSLVSLAISFWLLFRSGCAGDLKTGSLGDPHLALELEKAALPFFVFGLICPLALIALLRHLSVQRRIAIAAAIVLLGVPVLWLVGVQFEVWGVQHCS